MLLMCCSSGGELIGSFAPEPVLMMPNGQALRHDTGPSHASVEKAADKHDRTSSPVQSKSKGITWHTPHTYQRHSLNIRVLVTFADWETIEG